MAWWTFGIRRRRHVVPENPSLTAAAIPVPEPNSSLLRRSERWQDEVWDFWENLGELQYADDWKSSMMSRVRFFAAELEPGADEPVKTEESLPVDLMTMLAGGVSRQSAIISDLATQLDIPGEGYLVGEVAQGVERWFVRSSDEVRVQNRRFEVISENTTSSKEWRPLGDDHHVIRVYRPHKRWHHMAHSPARSARGAMRELELVNRKITSEYLSRLASAGLLVMPNEASFPVREEFADAPDPFAAEFIEVAATAIKEPGTAAAVVPMMIRVPAEVAAQIRHIDFTLQLDERVIERRDSAIKRLASQLNIPPEILLGMGSLNHWTAWQLEEGALKTVIAPDAELIADALTTGYLQPRLAASGMPDPGRFVVWYDMSELAIRPDRSANAFQAYDRLEINGEALRRETGFDDSDTPVGNELTVQAEKILLRTHAQAAPTAFRALTGRDIGENTDSAPNAETGDPDPAQGAPETGDEPPPPPGPDMSVRRTERLIKQAQAPHSVRFTVAGGSVLHPAMCREHAYSCPFTQAALKMRSFPHPGHSGVYECTLDTFGQLRIGNRSPFTDASTMVVAGSVNGHRL